MMINLTNCDDNYLKYELYIRISFFKTQICDNGNTRALKEVEKMDW